MNNFYKKSPARVNPVLINPEENRLKLDDGWKFKLDEKNEGLDKRWFEIDSKDIINIRPINVPGTWQGQGFGSDEKEQFLENQECRLTQFYKATYKGTGWYFNNFGLPGEWIGKNIWLNFGGVYPSADIWLNGINIGENHLPFVPFAFNITEIVDFSKHNILTVRVHEQDRLLGLAYSCHGNWSGLYRDVEITATGSSCLEYFIMHSDIDLKKINIRVKINTLNGSNYPLTLKVTAQSPGQDSTVESAEVKMAENEIVFDLPVAAPQPWSPDKPDLYRIDALLLHNDKVMDALSERTGFVKLTAKGNHFLINDEPYFMRGTGDFNSSPETGSPDTDRQRWRKRLSVLKEYGYNYVRCQSFVPAPEYFDAADEVGMLVQSEMGILGAWRGYSMWHGYVWPLPTPDYHKSLKEQWDNVVLRDVNHPSANIYCMSNELMEPFNGTHFPRLAWQCWHDTKNIKKTAMVIWTDGGYNEELPQDFVNYYYGKIKDICKKPIIEHEFRWWASYPDVRTVNKYCGAVLPCGVKLAVEAAKKSGIDHLLDKAAANSQRIQYIQAKGEIENCRRDYIDLAGISHFMAMDLTLSPQGIIDEFYEKKYADSSTWLKTNGDTVILNNLDFNKRVFSSGDTLKINFYVSDFSHPPLEKPVLKFRLTSGKKILKESEILYNHRPFCTCRAGCTEIVIPDISKPQKTCLEAVLNEGSRVFTNSWNLWLFPESVKNPETSVIYGNPSYTWIKGLKGNGTINPENLEYCDKLKVVLSEKLDEKLINFARTGGRIILAATECLRWPFIRKVTFYGEPMKEGYFFNSTVGCKPPLEENICGNIINDHKIFGDFPHEGFADLHFYNMIKDSAPFNIESLGFGRIEPIIRLMHSYLIARPLSYLMEFSLGRGGLILSSLDLNQGFPESRYLLSQMIKYASSEYFSPLSEISEDSLERIKYATQIP